MSDGSTSRLKGDARIWFYVEGVVSLEQVHTKHPNETK